MKLLDVQIDFFLPLWRRVALVAFCFVWSLVEFNNGMVFWGSVFVALGAYSMWQFFFDGWPDKQAVCKSSENDEIVNDPSTESNSASTATTESGEESSDDKISYV